MLPVLLILAASASAARLESIANSTNLGIGEKCYCYDKPWHQQPADCCPGGLVCHREAWRCVASVEYRDCREDRVCSQANSTYQRDMGCGPRDPHGNNHCCVKSYNSSLDNITLLLWRSPLTAGYARSCCSHKIEVLKGDLPLEYCA